jgi:hypothetical protein
LGCKLIAHKIIFIKKAAAFAIGATTANISNYSQSQMTLRINEGILNCRTLYFNTLTKENAMNI